MTRYGEAAILVLLAVPTALIDWQIAQTWHLAAWISLVLAAMVVIAFVMVLFVPALRAVASATAVALLYALPIIGGIIRWRLVASPVLPIGDGAFQIQVARDLLLRGVDPYGFNYVGTGMERTPWSQPFPNPSLHHFDYWPGSIVIPLPLQAAFQAVASWWDERLWLLVAAVAVWIIVSRLNPGPVGRTAAVAMFLIPGHSLLAVLGDNDLPMLALLLAAMLAIANRRWLPAGLCLGLAVATKQTALVALPLMVAWAFARGVDRRRFLQATGIGVAVLLGLLAPFLVWNWHAFLSDTILFNFGSGSEAYPIQGMGLSSLLLSAGVIHGSRDAFPFLLIQLPLLVGAWLAGWRWFRRRQSMGDAMLWMGVAFFVFFFTNRFTQQTYVLLAVDLIVAGLIGRLGRSVAEPAVAPISSIAA